MLKHFFEPESVAIIGASASPDKLGHAVLKNVIEGGYRGRLYPINPKATEILGLKAYPSVTALPETPDLAVVVIPYAHVAEAIDEAGEKGVRAAVVISAGFREAGLEGMKREIDVVERARKHNMRIVGPNCLGVIDAFTPLNATFAAGTPPSGPIGFMSQSGALGTAILDWAMAGSRIGFSKFVSLGNKADVSEIDLMEAWADDPHTKVILAYIEGLPNGPEFMRVAREVSRKKPIAVVKSGITSAGAKAVSSHTGSLAGSEQAYAAAFKQSGVLRAETMQDLFDFALGFAYQPMLQGDRIAIVTNAGGPGILCTDALEHAGLPMARLAPETTAKLKAGLPEAASSGNPVDVLGDALADRYLFALETVAADPNVDGLVVIVTPQAMTEIEATARAIGECAKHSAASERPIPVLSCIMGEWRVSESVEMLARDYGVPNYPFPERAAAAFAAMRDYRRLQSQPEQVLERFEVDNDRVRQVFRKAHEDGRVAVGDSESREILQAYNMRIPQAELARTPDEAVELAGKIGYPVVLKIASPNILHKTDVGGVRVNLNSPTDVRDAFELIVYRAQRYVPDAVIWGCLVQEMIPKGLEVLVGVNRDPQFGPLVTFGLGGIYVEALKDVTFRVAPFDRNEAQAMLGEIRAHALLDGVRGEKPADKDAIVDTLLRISQLVTDFPEIVELDINPLVVYPQGSGAIALDMRVVLSSK